jgi:quinol monooxygenase YgiN
MTIVVSGTLHVDPAQPGAYLQARVPILGHARRAPGCLDFSLTPDLLDPLASRGGGGPQHVSASEPP